MTAPYSQTAPSGHRRLRLGLIAFGVVAAAAVIYFLFFHHSASQQAKAAPPPAPPVTVSAPVSQLVTETDEFTGLFTAIDQVDLRARVSGYLAEIHFTDGQIIHKGDLLFVIDQRPFEIALAQAKASRAQAEAQLSFATAELTRAAELRQRDFISKSTFDQRNADKKTAEANLASAAANIRSANLNLTYSKIVAPVSGRISQRQISVGNVVVGGDTSSATLLTTIVSLDPVWFDFEMSEHDYQTYQHDLLGARSDTAPREVMLKLADEQGWPHTGKINFIDNAVDANSGTIKARAVLNNPDFAISPGQFGRLKIPRHESYQALLVPDSSVLPDQSRKIVMVVGADNKVMPKVVTVGPLVGNLRVIETGLDANDKVIIKGLMRARPGTVVTPEAGTIEADAAAPAAG